MNQIATLPIPTRPLRTQLSGSTGAGPTDSLQPAVERALSSDEGGAALAARLERYLPFLRAEYEECSLRGGLYQQILAEQPNLAPSVERLRARQRSILRGLAHLVENLRRGSSPQTDAECARLLGRLRSLRRAEERLVFEADFRDLGGEG